MKDKKVPVFIKESDYNKLSQLSANQNMSIEEELDQIIGTFLDCAENIELGKEK